MLNLIVYSLIFTALACSSQKEWDPSELGSAMATMEKSQTLDYGPQKKTDQNTPVSFIDLTESYGLANIDASNFMAVDLNEDGHSDLVLIADYFSQPEVYIFDPKEKRFNKSASVFDQTIKASTILFYDFNGDKITDALVGVLNQGTEISERALRLFVGRKTKEGLRFAESLGAIKLPPGPAATIVPVDYDLDGDLDLFVGNWFSKKGGVSLPEKDFLLENREGKFFDASEALVGENDWNSDRTMRVNATATFSSQICDMDLNGFPDILAVSTNGYLNKLWMNRYRNSPQGRVFRNYGVESFFAGDPDGLLNARGGGRTFAAACADYNHDGIMDVFLGELSHNHDADSIDKSSILTGSTLKFPPKFIRTEYVMDAHDLRWNQADKRGVWFDYNNDGLLDLWVDNSGFPPHTRALLFKQYPDHSFENVAKDAGVDFVNPQATIVLDVNGDGKLDVLTAQTDLRDARMKKRLYLFVNQTNEDNRSLRFFLRGNRANFVGLNATVELRVKTSKGVQTRIQQVSYSYGSLPPQNEEGIWFGLKKGEEALSVKVIWPYSKTLNSSRAGLEKFYQLEGKLNFEHRLNVTLCEVGIWGVGRVKCPQL